MNFIPGRWIESIQLTKGGSTVTNGYESITGQINTELLKNAKEPETSLNLFSDFNGRAEANITSVSPINDKWSQTFLLHGNGTFGNTDMNHDGFLDRPKGTQINAAYLLNYNDLEKSGFGSHFGINFIRDERTADKLLSIRNWLRTNSRPMVLELTFQDSRYGIKQDMFLKENPIKVSAG